MREQIEDVTIVGGGDSGLLTALSLTEMNPDLDVSIVDDFGETVPQVGKSTFQTITRILHDTLSIDEQRFVSEVRPVWKATVYFRDWCGGDPFHFPFDVPVKFPDENAVDALEASYLYYDELYDSPDHRTTGEEIVEQGTSPWFYDPAMGHYEKYDHVAYHLNTNRFNDFLRTLCRERGVSLIDDEVVGVETTGDRIDRVRSKSQAYEADLYVDATGFSRVLKGELDDEFVDFDFPLDAALNARVEHSLSDVVPATVVETGDYGWFWQIDTYDNRDLGYVYATDHVSDADARAEFVEYCREVSPGDGSAGDVSPDDPVEYTFDSGYYRRPWQGNCLTIGNAVGFVEPLQSTGLTTNGQSAATLANLLSSHGHVNDEWIRETYNRWVRRAWTSIYDFIAAHYRFADGDTDFWRAMRDVEVSPRLQLLIDEFDANGFSTHIDPTTNSSDVDDLLIFRPINFHLIMRHMGATSEYYESIDVDVSEETRREEDEFYERVRKDVASYTSVEEFYRGVVGE